MRGSRWLRFLDLVAILLSLCAPTAVSAEDKRAAAPIPLQLEVSINGQKIGFLGSFVLLDNQRLAATGEELQNLGILAPAGHDASPIPLDAIAGLTYRYDAPSQTINILVSDANLRAHEIGPPVGDPVPKPENQLIGAVVNYGLRGSLYNGQAQAASNALPQFQSLSFDSRLFGPMGTLSNSGFFSEGPLGDYGFVRLDSTWSWSDPDTLRTWRLGDVVTRGPVWSRPIRIGGGQVQTNFELRPDLVTAPLPTFHSSAAVPSTVDVYINNVETYSQAVQPGPFVISNLPSISGAGEARIVVRDATGRETVQSASFYNAPTLLRGALFDYSIEVGFVRGDYGSISDDYDTNPAASANARYGLTDTMTLEGHAEVGAGLVNGGVGTTFNLFDRGLLSFAVSASNYDGGLGAQVYAAFDTAIGPASLHLSTQHTVGNYEDLAGVIQPTILPASLLIPSVLTTSYAPPKTLDLATISLPVTAVGGDVSMSVINRITDDQSSLILSGTYSRPVIANASFFVSGFHDLDTQDTGLFAGLTVPLGNNGNAQVGVTSSGGQTGVSAEYDKTATHEPGSVGWRIGDSEGNIAARSAAVTYQASAARLEAGVDQLNNQISGWANVDGAVVATSGGVFFSNRVDDAFAVVDVGAPNVDVSLENLKVATTDANGRALIPGLRSYQRNKISIDPTALPSDAVTPDVATQAVPGDRNGVAVTFKSSSVSDAAVVVFRDHTGGYVPVGAVGTLTSTGQQFVVGYDGRAFIEGLGLQNTAKIDAGDQGCTASFSFKPISGTQVVIEDVMCK